MTKTMQKAGVLAQLRAEIARVEGRLPQLGPPGAGPLDPALALTAWQFGAGMALPLELAALHEMAPDMPAHWPSAVGVVLRLLLQLPPDRRARPMLWVQMASQQQERGRLCAAHVAGAGLALDQLVLLDVRKTDEALWALEEALHTPGLGAVVAAGVDIGFTASRRLSLACASAGVPLIHVPECAGAATAAATRWQVRPLPSAPDLLVPSAVGRARWQLTLTRARGARWTANLPANFDVANFDVANFDVANFDVANFDVANFDVEWHDATLGFALVPGVAPQPAPQAAPQAPPRRASAQSRAA